MKKYKVKKLILTPEDELIHLIHEAIDSLDLSCTSNYNSLSVWMTKPDEFLDESYSECVENESDPNIYYVTISGGMNNGWGIWSNYFATLHDLFIKLESVFQDAWVIEVWNDCLDDVFYVRLGIRAYFSHDSKPYTHTTQQKAKELDHYIYDPSDNIFHFSSIQRERGE